MALAASVVLGTTLAVVVVLTIVVRPVRIHETIVPRRRLRLVDLAAHSPNGFEGLVEAIFVRSEYKTLMSSPQRLLRNVPA